MNLRAVARVGTWGVALVTMLLPPAVAEEAVPGGGKALTVERIFAQPSLGGRPSHGLSWSPDGNQLGFLETQGYGKGAKTELWVMEAATGARRMLLSSEQLAAVLPAPPEKESQATGLGRHAPAEYWWAPDGRALLFVGPTSLAWYELARGTSRALLNGSEPIADVKLSPDGRTVSFVRKHNLWAISVADGKERALTVGGSERVRKGELDWVYPEELEITTAYWWSPDSKTIAFLELDERKVTTYPLVDFASYHGAAELERYPVAGGANPGARLFTVAARGGTPRLLDTGPEKDIYLPRVDWLRDSKRLAVQRMNRAQNQIDLLILDALSGTGGVVLSEKDQHWVNLSKDLYFLADGRRFLWSSERSGFRHLYVYDLEGAQLAQVTRGEWEVAKLERVDEKKAVVYFTASEKTPLESHLYRAGLDGSGFQRITAKEGTHSVLFSPNAAAFVDVSSTSTTPPRQDLCRADGSLIAAVNENKVPELDGYRLLPVEFLKVSARDGASLNARMIKPAGFDAAKKYPVLVFTYGGPHAQVVENAWGGTEFLWHELMAQKGFLVFALDNRGSAGRGHAFETPLFRQLGKQELEDQRAGAAYLRSLPFVDPGRIGIWGWSYGGHMTLHAMFEAGDDFKVGFAGGPVTDWGFYDSIYTERYMGLPRDNPQGYRSSSPIEHADQLTGKLLIAHGTGDDNVHFANTLALVDKLLALRKYVEVLPLPGRGHGASDPAAQTVLFNRVTRFFLDNL